MLWAILISAIIGALLGAYKAYIEYAEQEDRRRRNIIDRL